MSKSEAQKTQPALPQANLQLTYHYPNKNAESRRHTIAKPPSSPEGCFTTSLNDLVQLTTIIIRPNHKAINSRGGKTNLPFNTQNRAWWYSLPTMSGLDDHHPNNHGRSRYSSSNPQPAHPSPYNSIYHSSPPNRNRGKQNIPPGTSAVTHDRGTRSCFPSEPFQRRQPTTTLLHGYMPRANQPTSQWRSQRAALSFVSIMTMPSRGLGFLGLRLWGGVSETGQAGKVGNGLAKKGKMALMWGKWEPRWLRASLFGPCRGVSFLLLMWARPAPRPPACLWTERGVSST